ncbi:MAG: EcsC family protein [Candidatus Marinimicrobia bacterium]|nr:EcsC family protein [Candidatus Neomarinimicrobiota bacterium]
MSKRGADNIDNNIEDKPTLLKAIEIILADPADILRATQNLHEKFKKRYDQDKTEDEIADLVIEKIISNYSYYSAFVGGATALTGIVPGLGTLISAFGGATADAALSMKYQIEMTMAIAVVYGHNITNEEEKKVCLIVAGLGAINQAAKKGGKTVTTKAFTKMTQQYLKGATLQAVKQIFKKVGITFTRKAAEKAIPFGVGVIIGFSANKGLTWYVGTKAKDFFKYY